ncbi:hypothetical protein BGX38DRAFT_1155448 [Terfezia claveryi]|nr:hypothetical protein BGX38DRAFT_1155448 [Terfezia claveryi]
MKKGYVELRKDTPPIEGEVEAAVPIRAAVDASVIAVATPTPTTPGAPQAEPTAEGATKQHSFEEAKKAKKNEKKKRAQQRKRALAGTPAQQNPSMAAVTPVQSLTTTTPISTAVPPSGTETTPPDPEQDCLNNQWIRKHAKNASNKKKGFLNKMAGLLPKKYIYDEQGNRVEVPTTLANFSGTPRAYEDDVEQEQEEEGEKNGCLDAWRSRIVLSAVECEDEGFGAPQPTFPFVQPGWRRNGNTTQPVAGKKRKRGKGKRNHGSHYGYEHRQFDGASDGAGDDWDNYNYYEDEPVVGSAMKAQAEKADNARAATQMEVEEEDLPELPADITTLLKLTKDQVVSGAVVAFKQLTMDANYNPIMSDYRTALITEVVEETNGELALWMKLAKRDRPKKRYDEETGERLFGKFEIPGEEGDDDEVMDIMFGDMIEPRVVKPAEGVVKSVVAELDMEATPVQISGDGVIGDGGQEPPAAEEQVPDDGKTGGEVNNLSNNLNQEERGLITENTTGAEAMDLDNQDHVMLSAAEAAAGAEGIEDEAEKSIDRDREMVDVRTDEGVVAVQEEEVRVTVAVAVELEQQVLGEVGNVEGRMQPRQVQNDSQLQKRVERESEKDELGGIESLLGLDRNGARSAGAEAVTGDGGTIDSSVRQKAENEQQQEEEEVLPVVNSGAPVMVSTPYTTSYTVQSPQYTPWADDLNENIIILPPRFNPAASIEVGKEVEEGSQVDVANVEHIPHPREENSSNDAPLPEEFKIPDSSQPSSIAEVQTETPLPQLPSSPSSEVSNAQPPQDSPHSELLKQRPPPTLTRQDSWDDELPELDERGYLITKTQKASSQLKPLVKEEKKQPKQSTPADSTMVVPLKTIAKVASSPSAKVPADTTPPPTVTPKKRVVGRKTIIGPRVRPSLTGIKAVEIFTPDNLFPPPSTAPARVSGASAGQSRVSSSSKRKSSIASASASSSTPPTRTDATTKARGPAGSAAKIRESAGGSKYIIDLTGSGDEKDEKLTLPPLPSSQPVARPRVMYDVPPPSSQPQQKQVKQVKQVISSEPSAPVPGSSSMTLMEDGTWRSAVKARKF